MTYKLLARVPTLDTTVNIFFTTMSVRDWTFGRGNQKHDDFIFESIFLLNASESTTVQVILKQAQVWIPFTATIHFDNTTFTQNFEGVWNGTFIYDYEIATGASL